jgi:hypothetical protein
LLMQIFYMFMKQISGETNHILKILVCSPQKKTFNLIHLMFLTHV